MTSVSTDDLRNRLSTARDSLLEAIRGVTEQQFKRRPAATPEDSQPWCIAEILTHLLIDEQIWSGRISTALDAPGTEVQPSDREQQAADVKAGRLAPVPQIIHGLLAAHRDFEKLLERIELTPGSLASTVHQPVRGVLSVEWMMRKVIDHEAEHAVQIESIKQAMAAESASPI